MKVLSTEESMVEEHQLPQLIPRFTKNDKLQKKIKRYPRTNYDSESISNNVVLGSAGSYAMSQNGSIKSDYSEFGDDSGDNINVVIRVRPLNSKEIKQNDVNIIQFPGEGGIWVDEQKKDKIKPYTFNVVFEPEATQEDILDHSGIKRLIDMAVDGFSTTVFCYGQTGSGKTHTLTGPPDLEKVFTGSSHKVIRDPNTFRKHNLDPGNKNHGLVLRSFIYLYDQLAAKSEFAHFRVKASYLEIYNEKVIDLLNPGPKRSNLAVRWNKKSRAHVVDNLFSIECDELSDLVAVLEEGLRNRAIGSHNMNEHSSRSHTILTVFIQSEEKATSEDNNGVFITRHGKINFVDLAGSEMTKKTKSEGKTLEEANNINKSLMVLGYCIAQLSTQKRTDRVLHIPYRDSKLTKLLADSLAGNGVTLMIACVSPAKSNLSETTNTLRYAARAKKIKTKPVVVMDPREALIVSLKREVGILLQENNHLRQLLELADSDSGIQQDIRRSSSSSVDLKVGSQGMSPSSFSTLPLDGRGERAETEEDDEDDDDDGSDDDDDYHHLSRRRSRNDQHYRPFSQKSRDTLRRVSSLLFIATPATVKKIDKSRLGELESSTLVDLIKDYMNENQDLRRENQDLFSVRDLLLRDQDLVCRENERLLKKLEDVNSVCCRSPIIPARPSYSAEMLSMSFSGSLPRSSGNIGSVPDNLDSRSSPVTNVWINPMIETPIHRSYDDTNSSSGRFESRKSADEDTILRHKNLSRSSGSLTPTNGKPPHRLPDNINKELEKRKIGNSMTNITDTYRRSKTVKSGSLDSDGSPDGDFFGRKKPGQLKDNLSASRGSLHSSPEESNNRSSVKSGSFKQRTFTKKQTNRGNWRSQDRP